jgi:uncharacterized protein (DUF2336 family)
VNPELVKDLQDAISKGSSDRRASVLQGVAQLLIAQGDRLTDEQIEVFDAILVSFVSACEAEALTELSHKLAPVAYGPHSTLKHLAVHPDIKVAGPVLTTSPKLSSDDLIEAAAAHGQDHLMAISKRQAIDEALSDVLIELGDRDVRYSVASNEGAKVSAAGFKHLVATADGDSRMTEKTALRADLPSHLLTKLLKHTNHAVRARLLAKTPVQRRAEVQRSVASIEKHVEQEAVRPRDFRSATELVQGLKATSRLTEDKLLEFAKQRQYETIIVALATLASAPIELIRPLMRSHRGEGLIVACRAAEVGWETTQAVILSRLSASSDDCAKLRKRYDELPVAIAKRTLNIWKEQALRPRRFAS